jgi:hypothetical protein
MRYILIILLFCSVGANAQMVIKAHPNYVPFASVNIFAQTSNTYSLRKVISSYTGSAIRVRKDTTGQPEQDIGFLGSGELDTVSLKSFLNARSGFAVTWYSQNNNQNATQATAANQPRIALNGVIDRLGGKPTLLFDGSNDFMSAASFNNNAVSIYTVFSRTGGSSLFRIILRKGFTTNNTFEYLLRNTSPSNFLEGSASTGLSFNTVNTNPSTVGGVSGQPDVIKLGIFIFDNTNIKIALNNDNLSTSALSGTLFQGSSPLIIGAQCTSDLCNGYSAFWPGRISEILIYGADKTNDNADIKTNINTFYSIY